MTRGRETGIRGIFILLKNILCPIPFFLLSTHKQFLLSHFVHNTTAMYVSLTCFPGCYVSLTTLYYGDISNPGLKIPCYDLAVSEHGIKICKKTRNLFQFSAEYRGSVADVWSKLMTISTSLQILLLQSWPH
jgi:hypothetical protein